VKIVNKIGHNRASEKIFRQILFAPPPPIFFFSSGYLFRQKGTG